MTIKVKRNMPSIIGCGEIFTVAVSVTADADIKDLHLEERVPNEFRVGETKVKCSVEMHETSDQNYHLLKLKFDANKNTDAVILSYNVEAPEKEQESEFMGVVKYNDHREEYNNTIKVVVPIASQIPGMPITSMLISKGHIEGVLPYYAAELSGELIRYKIGLRHSEKEIEEYKNYAQNYKEQLDRCKNVERELRGRVEQLRGCDKDLEKYKNMEERCAKLPKDVVSYLVEGNEKFIKNKISNIKEKAKKEKSEWMNIGLGDVWIKNILFSEMDDILGRGDIEIYYYYEYISKLLRISEELRQNDTFRTMLIRTKTGMLVQ